MGGLFVDGIAEIGTRIGLCCMGGDMALRADIVGRRRGGMRQRGRGQTLVEYVLIVAFVSVAAIGVLRAFSQSVQSTADSASAALSGPMGQ